MRSLIGHNNEGFDIIEATYTGDTQGYVLGQSATQFVTWYFVLYQDETRPDFHHGNYFVGTDLLARARAYADYHTRIAEGYRSYARYLKNAKEG